MLQQVMAVSQCYLSGKQPSHVSSTLHHDCTQLPLPSAVSGEIKASCQPSDFLKDLDNVTTDSANGTGPLQLGCELVPS